MAELVMIPVTEKTKHRVFQHRTKPGITYDMLVNAAFDALEEKISESRSPSAKIKGTGMIPHCDNEVIS